MWLLKELSSPLTPVFWNGIIPPQFNLLRVWRPTEKHGTNPWPNWKHLYLEDFALHSPLCLYIFKVIFKKRLSNFKAGPPTTMPLQQKPATLVTEQIFQPPRKSDFQTSYYLTCYLNFSKEPQNLSITAKTDSISYFNDRNYAFYRKWKKKKFAICFRRDRKSPSIPFVVSVRALRLPWTTARDAQ